MASQIPADPPDDGTADTGHVPHCSLMSLASGLQLYVNPKGDAGVTIQGQHTNNDASRRKWIVGKSGLITLSDGRQLYATQHGWAAVAAEGEGGNTEQARREWTMDSDGVVSLVADGRQLYINLKGWAGLALAGQYTNTAPGRRLWHVHSPSALTADWRDIPAVSEVIGRHCESGSAYALVTRNGRVIHSKGYGGVNSATSLGLLSVTKQFTAMSAAILIEEGKLEPSAPVSRYLPELKIPVNGRELLVQDLLWHVCGLADFLSGPGWVKASNEKHAGWLATMEPPAPPGEKMSYNNSGYVLLARVVEVIAGEPYHKFQKRRIFDVLEMNATSDHASFNGSGRIWTTLNDYAKWDDALWRQDERLLSPAGYQMLWTRGVLDNGELVNYGLGWFLAYEDDKLTLVHHTGSGIGWRNVVKRYIADNTTVAVFTSKNPSFERVQRHQCADEVLAVVQKLAAA